MDIILDKSSATEASITVKLSEADYEPNVDKKIKEYSKKANIKGFRPGKAPSTLIKKLYGKSIMVEELNQMLSSSITNYIKENNLKIIGDPLPNMEKSRDIDWDNQKEFEFEYEVGLIGDFNYSLNTEITRYDIEIDDKSIDEAIENLLIQYGETINPESSEEGDYLYGSLKQKDGEIERDTVIALFEVNENERKAFIGVKPEDTITFDIRKTFAEDRLIGLVTGKTTDEAKDISGEFSFQVNKIDRRAKAELNQEFFDKLFGPDQVKTEEELKGKIAENLKENYARETDFLLTHHIRTKLLEETDIELPKNFLIKWLKVNDEKIDDSKIENEFDNYLKELKWSVLRNKIAEDLNLSVDKEEIHQKARSVVSDYLKSSGMPPQFLEENIDKLADNYLQGGEGKTYMELHEQVKNEKIINAVKEQLKINQKTVNIEEFKKVVSN